MNTPSQLERILAAYRLTLDAWSYADTAKSREDSEDAAWYASEALQSARHGDLFSALKYARDALEAEAHQGVPCIYFPLHDAIRAAMGLSDADYRCYFGPLPRGWGHPRKEPTMETPPNAPQTPEEARAAAYSAWRAMFDARAAARLPELAAEGAYREAFRTASLATQVAQEATQVAQATARAAQAADQDARSAWRAMFDARAAAKTAERAAEDAYQEATQVAQATARAAQAADQEARSAWRAMFDARAAAKTAERAAEDARLAKERATQDAVRTNREAERASMAAEQAAFRAALGNEPAMEAPNPNP